MNTVGTVGGEVDGKRGSLLCCVVVFRNSQLFVLVWVLGRGVCMRHVACEPLEVEGVTSVLQALDSRLVSRVAARTLTKGTSLMDALFASI